MSCEFGPNDLDNSKTVLNHVQNVMADLHRGKIDFHYTFRYPGIEGKTFGGLFETRDEAQAMKDSKTEETRKKYWATLLATMHGDSGIIILWLRAQIVKLAISEHYSPMGRPFDDYCHGLDDGQHDSVNKDETIEEV
jgi:hypothetical protein